MSKTYQYADDVLKNAAKIVAGDRKADYGDAADSFASIAGFWTHYLRTRGHIKQGHTITGTDVAMMMDLLKTSRFATGGYKEDTFIDKGGYAALGGALARMEAEQTPVTNALRQPSTSIFPDED